MAKYEKFFTRDNGLLVFELWDECETKKIRGWLGWTVKSYLLDGVEGVTAVYYDPENLEEFKKRVARKLMKRDFLPRVLAFYKKAILPLQEAWRNDKPLKSKEDLIKLFNQGVSAWVGLAITYFIPGFSAGDATPAQKKSALAARKGTDRFFDATDRIFEKTLRKLFPKIRNLSRFISIQELRSNKIPTIKVLKDRQKQFIFYKGKVVTGESLQSFAGRYRIALKKEIVGRTDILSGQTAMKGIAQGKVRMVMKKENIATVRKGEVLVTAMTTPDFLPAMHKAAAFVTDEGGITCHAAIIARELKKPCIIWTKVATSILKNGDLVEVDANKGIVRILKRR